ncbi:hypothetical protein B488_12540 [Liberibacter crescens BT-1]|uniref:Uncharacterized protein n=1 Tax=Liberibacter crescens (strain BT-1) TaxID=1215343 RepID=L0EXY8_LIBCB|nr:hypothetical protein B488_12540 [Liberibacter crescens BT-1]
MQASYNKFESIKYISIGKKEGELQQENFLKKFSIFIFVRINCFCNKF